MMPASALVETLDADSVPRPEAALVPQTPPLPACGERSPRFARRVRGTLRESERVESPPHPDPLPASGERERTELAERHSNHSDEQSSKEKSECR